MLADLHFGNYANTVIELQKRLTALVKPPDKLEVVAVGHGGRDCWVSLLLVQAVATNDLLCNHVQIVILSCTWPGDRWEELMEKDLARFPLFVRSLKFQFHREHHIWVQDLRCHLQRADIILQCEQGVDYFVPPGRLGKHVLVSPFLQDNYEDWMVFYEGMLHVMEKPQSQMWLLQTNPDLDIGRGISRLELQHEVFGQQLKCEHFSNASNAPTNLCSLMLQ